MGNKYESIFVKKETFVGDEVHKKRGLLTQNTILDQGCC